MPATFPNSANWPRTPDPVYSRGRGFGFMPPIDIARAAKTAIDKISNPGRDR